MVLSTILELPEDLGGLEFPQLPEGTAVLPWKKFSSFTQIHFLNKLSIETIFEVLTNLF